MVKPQKAARTHVLGAFSSSEFLAPAFHACHLSDQGGHLLQDEAAQGDSRKKAILLEAAHGIRQRLVQVFSAISTYEQYPLPGDVASQVLEKGEGRLIGPMEVINKED